MEHQFKKYLLPFPLSFQIRIIEERTSESPKTNGEEDEFRSTRESGHGRHQPTTPAGGPSNKTSKYQKIPKIY